MPVPALEAVGASTDASRFALAVDGRYLLLAPLHALLDQLSLLTLPGHAAVLMTAALAGALVGARLLPLPEPTGASRNDGTTRAGAGRRATQRRAAGAGGAVALAAVLALCAWGTMGYRPMLRLTGARADELVIDFHAHTDASHDARRGWNREQLTEWLASAGFHAAYVTDHGALWPESWAGDDDGSRAAGRGNPGVRLLPGNEVRGMGEHLNILGVTTRQASLFWDGARRVHLDSLRAALRTPDAVYGAPIVLVTSPLKRAEPLDPALVHAIEVSDAAPKGLAFGWRHRPWLARLADSLGLVRLSGTDQHGWGRAAAAWSVLHLPGWRALPPAALDRAIRDRLRQRPSTIAVLERPPLPGTGASWGIALTVPLVLHAVFTRISWPERLAWLGWTWGCWGLLIAVRATTEWRARVRRLATVRVRRAARALARPRLARPQPARSLGR